LTTAELEEVNNYQEWKPELLPNLEGFNDVSIHHYHNYHGNKEIVKNVRHVDVVYGI